MLRLFVFCLAEALSFCTFLSLRAHDGREPSSGLVLWKAVFFRAWSRLGRTFGSYHREELLLGQFHPLTVYALFRDSIAFITLLYLILSISIRPPKEPEYKPYQYKADYKPSYESYKSPYGYEPEYKDSSYKPSYGEFLRRGRSFSFCCEDDWMRNIVERWFTISAFDEDSPLCRVECANELVNWGKVGRSSE